jgi:hypothetical protein
MPLLDDDTVGDFLAEEIPAALQWAATLGVTIDWDEAARVLTSRFQGASQVEGQIEHYLLIGSFEDYRAVPPTWRFVDPRTDAAIGAAALPQGALASGSVFHGNGVICAPWSRDAYGDRNGPHQDWTDATNWQTTAPQHTQANTIADMLARIFAEIQLSPGRMAPLPPAAEAAAA